MISNKLLNNRLRELNVILNSGSINRNALIILQKYPCELNSVMEQTSFLDPGCSMGERIYCIRSNINTHPVCSNLTCSQKVRYVIRTRYNSFCSLACSANSQEVRKKTATTNLQRFGSTCTLLNSEVAERSKATKLRKYGVIHPLQNHKIKQRQTQTMVDRYNVPNFNYADRDFPFEQLKDKKWLEQQHVVEQKPLHQIAKELNIDTTTVSRYCKQHDIKINHYFTSAGQKHLTDFLCNELNVAVCTNDRLIIPPHELDIWIPEKKIAIEYCGLYWHSELHSRINRFYHENKLQACLKQNIELITLYEDEWYDKQQIVKSVLTHKLNKTVNVVYARECKVVDVCVKYRREFLNNYHLLGDGNGSIVIGLTHSEKIIAVMVFKKTSNECMILNRYATAGCSVVGGFSKLLNHFTSNYQWNKILTFADLRWSVGNLYFKNSFKLDKHLPPDYEYIVGARRVHKFNFRRKHLHKKLKHFDSMLSESENCINNNIHRIWNCGLYRFVLENKEQKSHESN